LATEGWEVAYKGLFFSHSSLFLDLIFPHPAFKGFREGLEVISGQQIVLHCAAKTTDVETSENFTDASTFGRVLRTAAEFCEFLGYIGVVVDGIILIMPAIQGAEQYVSTSTIASTAIRLITPPKRKTKLIDAIHKTQVSRLACASFSGVAMKVTSQVESFVDYLTMAASSDPDDQAGARAVRSLFRLPAC
jgi:hypothetical protein